MIRRPIFVLLATSLVASCDGVLPVAGSAEPGVVRTVAVAPPGAAPGTCWGKDVSPAVIETVTEQILLQPAQLHVDGTVREPAIYKTETRQAIVKERRETWFETLCQEAQTPEFISTLQRALTARGLYRGAINGQMDTRTRAAIRRFQAPQGLDSGILSIAAARQMGLVAVKRAEE